MSIHQTNITDNSVLQRIIQVFTPLELTYFFTEDATTRCGKIFYSFRTFCLEYSRSQYHIDITDIQFLYNNEVPFWRTHVNIIHMLFGKFYR